jgi:hypothetical protein
MEMRGIILAMTVAAGIGLVGTAGGAVAAPVSGTAILDATADPVTQVQHWRWGSRGWHSRRRSHWRWGSRGYRCHLRYRSVWVRC